MASPVRETLVSSVRGLKALAHPLRSRIIALLHEPQTVKALARAMRVDPVKLYYHVNLLVKAGIVEVAATTMRSGVEERTFRLIAQRIRIASDGAASRSRGSEREWLTTNILRTALAELSAYWASSPRRKRRVALLSRDVRLPAAALEEIMQKLDDVVSAYALEAPMRGAEQFSFTLAFVPRRKEPS